MKNLFTNLILGISFFMLASCSTSSTAHLEGVYRLDKEAFLADFESDIDEENAFLVDLMKMAIENASIEVQIKGDSLYGIINTMELENSIQSKIFLRNDSLLIIDQESEICLMETEGGISLSPLNSEITFELRKTENKELSEDTKTAINENK